jgi:hypothetical protein
VFRLYFDQVHRVAVVGTILMGGNRALLEQVPISRVQEIALKIAVMDETKRFLAGIYRPIFV